MLYNSLFLFSALLALGLAGYARQLAMVFRNESVVTIYRMLGLKSL